MKFFKVISFVVLGHILLVGSFLLSPGCKSIDRQWAEYRREKQTVNVPREVLAQEQGLPPDSEEIDPNLNAGIGGSAKERSRVRTAPTRPSSSSTGPVVESGEAEPAEPLFNPGLSGGINAPAEPGSPTSGYISYTVQRGDTLWGLSKEYGVPFVTLVEANGMTRDTQLSVGQEILVPSGYDEVVVTETVMEEPAAPAGTTIYTVRRGDTLSEIAARSGTSVSRIRNLNNMTGDRIRIGQKLIVPGEMVVVEEETTLDVPDFDPDDYTAVHVVDRGETPSGIANRYGMSAAELLAVNGITDARLLRAGSELKVKPAPAGSKSSPSAGSPLLRPREESDLPPAINEESATEPESEEDQPVAPPVVPREPTPVETEPIEDEEGFGAEIFEDFEGFEEVPVDRRSSGEG